MFDPTRPAFIADTSSPTSIARDGQLVGTVAFVPANSGEDYWVMGALFSYLVTGEESSGRYFTLLVDLAPDSGPPPHIHHVEAEQFYVLEGQLTYFVGDLSYQANAGDFIHIPCGAVHWFKNGGIPARLLATFAPAGIEGFFREIGERAQDRLETPPPVTPDMISRLMAAEARGWRDHHDTLLMKEPAGH